MRITFTRFDKAFDSNESKNKIDEFTLYGQNEGKSNQLVHMRDFAAHKEGVYLVKFPNNSNTNKLEVVISEFKTDKDELIVGFQFEQTSRPKVYLGRRFFSGNLKDALIEFSSVNSYSALASSNGSAFWHDASKKRVWVKIKGGIISPNSDKGETTNMELVID